MSVGCDIGDAITRSHPERLQHRRPAVAPVEELLIGEPQISIYDGFAVRVQPAGASCKFEGSEWSLQNILRASILAHER
jgi:hypothetical protein